MAPIRLKAFRFDPDTDDNPHYAEYSIDAVEEAYVLVLLNRIQREIDPTLSFRSYCCGLQTCRSCLMRINGKRMLACITVVKPGEEVVVEPLTYPTAHVKDLVVLSQDDETEDGG